MPAVVGTTMTSTPTSQTAIMESSTAADKKRNKLGYHRTSVACGQFFFSGPEGHRCPLVNLGCLSFHSALSATKDTMFGGGGRRSRSMWELYSTEKGVSVLPSWSAAANRKESSPRFEHSVDRSINRLVLSAGSEWRRTNRGLFPLPANTVEFRPRCRGVQRRSVRWKFHDIVCARWVGDLLLRRARRFVNKVRSQCRGSWVCNSTAPRSIRTVGWIHHDPSRQSNAGKHVGRETTDGQHAFQCMEPGT